MTTRRAFLGGAMAAAAFGPAARAGDEHWPNRPIKLIVPYPAGGSTDVLARLLGEQFKERLGQTVIIENRAGAGGNIGIAALAASPPDGYTIGAATVGHFSINQFLYTHMPYDPEHDIVPASLTWELPNVFVVATDFVPARTLQEFIAWAKPRGQIPFGSPGTGTSPHLCGALFGARTGVSVVHVPFRGAAQTIPAMLSGDVVYAIDNLASYTSTIEGGKMRALAVTSAERWPTLPDVPTMAEAGLTDFVVTSWGAFVVPAGTPQPVIGRIADTMRDIAADAGLQQRFLIAGARCIASTPAQAAARAAQERPMWQEMIRISGAQPQ